MIGKVGAKLDRAKLDDHCEERVLQKRQQTRLDMRSKLEEIQRNSVFPVEEEEGVRESGIQRQGYDVWTLILERVFEPTEIFKLRGVSKMFQDILKEKYIQARLPEIVHFILDKHPNYFPPDQSESDKSFWNLRPTDIPPDRDQSDKIFWKLRLVSKQCQTSTDDVLYSKRMYISKSRLKFRSIGKLRKICTYIRANPSYAATFFSKMNIKISESEFDSEEEEDESNSILSYLKKLLPGQGQAGNQDNQGQDQGGFDTFPNAVKTFLDLVGHQIRTFSYVSYKASHRQMYENIREWVALMPNLERLSLDWNHYLRLYDKVQPVPTLEELQPFPQCNNLQYFLEFEEGLPLPYVHRILEACPVIKDVKFRDGEFVREHSTEILGNLGNLETLSICPFGRLLPREQLQMNWPLLKTLILDRKEPDLEEQHWKTSVSSGKLFSFLKQFGDTLQDLEITIDVTDCCDSCGYLELPNLKRLKWAKHESFENLDFMLYLGKLEELEVTIERNVMRELTLEEAYNKIVGHESGSFLGKGIWDVFPYLKKVRLCRHSWIPRAFEKRRELM